MGPDNRNAQNEPQPRSQLEHQVDAGLDLTPQNTPSRDTPWADVVVPQTDALVHLIPQTQVDQRIKEEGFPALEKAWRMSKSLPIMKEPLQEHSEIMRDTRYHTIRFFGRPVLCGAVASLSGTVLAAGSVASGPVSLNTIIGPCLAAVTIVNGVGLSLLAINALHSYVVSPFKKVIARHVRFMLSVSDYRRWIESTPEALATRDLLRSSGISDAWDNPTYHKRYRKNEGQWEVVTRVAPIDDMRDLLRTFLGHKDPHTRMYKEGDYSHALRDRKRSVTAFTNRFSNELTQLRSGTLPHDLGAQLLKTLLNDYVVPESYGAHHLRTALNSITSPSTPLPGEVLASVWKRDPWCDITRQTDFFSSASLRGDKLIEGGSKGRVGSIAYLQNVSIVGLEFSTHKGRAVRVRMAAVYAETHGGARVPALLVDAVEGSNSLDPAVIKEGIESYARDCGFRAVLYYAYPLNKVPQRFVRFVAQGKNTTERAVQVEFFDAKEPQYLEAFGLPIQGFEYARPIGRVPVLAHSLSPSDEVAFPLVTALDRVKSFFRRNSLNLAVASACTQCALNVSLLPQSLAVAAGVPLACVTGVLIAYQVYFGRRALRAG